MGGGSATAAKQCKCFQFQSVETQRRSSRVVLERVEAELVELEGSPVVAVSPSPCLMLRPVCVHYLSPLDLFPDAGVSGPSGASPLKEPVAFEMSWFAFIFAHISIQWMGTCMGRLVGSCTFSWVRGWWVDGISAGWVGGMCVECMGGLIFGIVRKSPCSSKGMWSSLVLEFLWASK